MADFRLIRSRVAYTCARCGGPRATREPEICLNCSGAAITADEAAMKSRAEEKQSWTTRRVAMVSIAAFVLGMIAVIALMWALVGWLFYALEYGFMLLVLALCFGPLIALILFLRRSRAH